MGIYRRGMDYLHSRYFGFGRLPRTPGITNEPRNPSVAISLTSYPGRIKVVSHTVKSLLKQTVKPNRVILYLSKIQFPDEKLPKSLIKAQEKGLTVRFVDDDLRPHKKYFYAMQEYPEDIVITCDDDIYYDPRLVESLLRSYSEHPHCISAMRAHHIIFNDDGTIAPYTKWERGNKGSEGEEHYNLMATGIGGVLYPPKSIPDWAFDTETIKKTCINADDLWLKIAEIRNHYPVVLVKHDWLLKEIFGTKKSALCNTNVGEDRNTVQLKAILKELGNESKTIIKVISEDKA